MRGANLTTLLLATALVAGLCDGATAATKHKGKAAAEAPLAPATRGPTSTADVIGRYAILRSGKDTGCMLTLSAATALLAPACRDNGIVVFDPKSWALSQRRLVLRARKGHSTTFEMSEAGVWEKDPRDAGKPLGLRKM